MYSYARAFQYALILWGLTFLFTFLIFSPGGGNTVLFTTLRVLTIVLLSVLLTVMYFRDVDEHLVRDGFRLGLIWLATGVLLDQGPFVWGLMHLSFAEYLMDSGLGYLTCPTVTVGAGLLLSTEKDMIEDSEA
jgi:EamA domain-containing membrane protein RarD